MDDPEAAETSPCVVLLYVYFAGLGGRWETDAEGTAAVLLRAEDRFAAAAAACGGAPLPAWVDARCARFPTAGAALAAARAVRRAERAAGEVEVRLAVAGGKAWPGGEVPVPLLRRAWELAEAAGSDEVLLDEPAAAALDGGLPPGARLGRTWRHQLPGLDCPARVFVLREPGPPEPASPGPGQSQAPGPAGRGAVPAESPGDSAGGDRDAPQ